MTREEVDFIGSMNMCGEISNEAYKKIMCHCEEQEPCDDVVSRKAVEDAVIWNDEKREMLDEIQKLPSVQPQQKTGHWEWVQYDYNPKLGNWHCSECRCVVVECVDKNEKGGIPLYKYCPQCGAKMVEPPESEDKE